MITFTGKNFQIKAKKCLVPGICFDNLTYTMDRTKTCPICGTDLPTGSEGYTLICETCESGGDRVLEKERSVSEMIHDLSVHMTDSDIEEELDSIKDRFGSDVFERYNVEDTIKNQDSVHNN